MIEDLKDILYCEMKRRKLSIVELAEISGVPARNIQRALCKEGTNAIVSIWVYEELYHALGIRLRRAVAE